MRSKDIPEQEVQPSHDRYLSLVGKFWRGAKLSRAEMAELDRLHLWNVDRIWAATAAKEEVEK